MAKIIADELNGELDVVLVHKLGAPGNPEFAIGSVDETGWAMWRIMPTSRGGQAIHKKRSLHSTGGYTAAPEHNTLPYANRLTRGRIVIVADDGLATGSTMLSALHALKIKKPAELICAVPVAPPDTVEKVSATADRVVCLATPINFQAVAQFYREFPQVTDEEAIATLSAAGHPIKNKLQEKNHDSGLY